HSLQVNLDFILSEFDKAIEVLPLQISDEAWAGRINRGAAMAAKSRVTLYAARPLFNGAEIYRGMKNYYGDDLFPQQPDPNKWEVAADAAKAVIDLNQYALYKNTTESDPFKRAIKSYMGIFFEFWNEEVIWGRWYS